MVNQLCLSLIFRFVTEVFAKCMRSFGTCLGCVQDFGCLSFFVGMLLGLLMCFLCGDLWVCFEPTGIVIAIVGKEHLFEHL